MAPHKRIDPPLHPASLRRRRRPTPHRRNPPPSTTAPSLHMLSQLVLLPLVRWTVPCQHQTYHIVSVPRQVRLRPRSPLNNACTQALHQHRICNSRTLHKGYISHISHGDPNLASTPADPMGDTGYSIIEEQVEHEGHGNHQCRQLDLRTNDKEPNHR